MISEIIPYAITGLVSTSVGAVIAYVLKRVAEGRIRYYFDSKVEEIRHRHEEEKSALKSYFDKELEDIKHEHQKEISVLKSRLETLVNQESDLYKAKLQAYTELSAVVYRCRLAAKRAGEKAASGKSESELTELQKEHRALHEALKAHIVLVDGARFDRIHGFKDDIGVLATYLAISGNEGVDRGRMLGLIAAKCRTIDDAYRLIVDDLQGDVLGSGEAL